MRLTLRIGSVDDSVYALTRVPPGGVAVGSQGEVYVAQPADQEIRVFDSHGRWLRTIGRRGGGPGEFMRLTSIGVIGDTLYAMDSTPPRVSYFGHDGGLLKSFVWTTAPAPEYAPTPPYSIHRGSSLAIASPLAFVLTDERLGPATMVHVVIDRTGAVVDTLLAFSGDRMATTLSSGGRLASIAYPFPDYPLLALIPDGTGAAIVHRDYAADSHQGTFRIAWREVESGTPLMVREYAYAPVPLSSVSAAETIDRLLDRMEPALGHPSARGALRDRLVRGRSSLPPVQAIAYGSDGVLWVRREDRDDRGQQWDLVDGDGSVLGRLRLPAVFAVQVAVDQAILGVEHDSLGVPHIVRYEVVR